MKLLKNLYCISAVVFVAFAGTVTPAFAEAKIVKMGTLDVSRILFLGNSITRSSDSPSVGWTGNWGMAASEQAKDYVHVLTNEITQEAGATPEIMISTIIPFERNYADASYNSSNIKTYLASQLAFNPTLIVVAIGENAAVSTAAEKTAYATAYGNLISALKTAGSSPVIFSRSCFWANTAKDTIMKTVTEANGGTYVDISDLCKHDENYAWGDSGSIYYGVKSGISADVGKHPGDIGMAAIAGELMTSMTAASVPEPSTFALAAISIISIAAYRLRHARKQS
jgi:hypothetical protein